MRNKMLGVLPISFLNLMVVILFCLGATGCSLFKSVAGDKDQRELFKSRDQYVRIIKQESAKGVKVPLNEQPVLFDEDQIRMALGTLEFMLPGKTESSPVFEKPELEILGKYLSSALAQAGTDEDVSFAVVGDYLAVYGVAREQMYTSGRVFYRDGKLNIIFGDIHGKYWANADRRLYPMNPGSRLKPTKHTWVLLGQPDQQFYIGPNGQRTDWITLDIASMEARAAMGEEASASQPSGVPGVQTFYAPQKSVEERLLILNDLKKKNLVTDEEYQKKKQDILKDL